MDNKTQSFQFRKTKLALAVAMTVSLAACGVDGDEGSTTTSNSNSQVDSNQNTVGNQNELTGTVTGTVLDTNGNPIVGASVYLAGKTTTTDAGGQYVFSDVPVVNVAGVNNEGDEAQSATGHAPLVITIMAADHLGATVTVSPQAMVNNTGGQDNDSNGGTNSETTVQTFIDGFIAQAGTAKLPTITKKVSGYLRDCATNGPLVGGKVAFDFVGVESGDDVAPGTTIVNTAAGEYVAMTDETGKFELTLPADSTLTFLVDGFLSADTDGNSFGAPTVGSDISTGDEQISMFLGTVEVCSTGFEAEVKPNVTPYVTSVNGVVTVASDTIYGSSVDTSAAADNKVYTAATSSVQNIGLLNVGVDKVFVINLSEALDTTLFRASDVRVVKYSTSGNTFIDTDSVTLSEDGKVITVTATTALAAGTKFSVLIPRFDSVDSTGLILDTFGDDYNGVLDEASNVRTAGVGDPFDALAGLAADELTAAPGDKGAESTGITYDYFFEGTNKASYVKVNLCVFSPVNTGGSGTAEQIIDDLAGSDASSSALASYSDSFQDSRHDGNTVVSQVNGQTGTDAKLQQLAQFIAPGSTVVRGESNIFVDIDGASSYTLTGGGTGTADDNEYVTGNQGAKFTAKFFDGFGVQVASNVVTLVDAIPATTVIQDDYDVHSYNNAAPYAATNDSNGLAEYGNGGETSDLGTVDVDGNPIIWIQPRHLAAKGAGGANPVRGTEFAGLTSGMSARLGAGETQVAPAANVASLSTYDTDHALYDRTAFAAWAAITQDIGVAFSEDVSLTASAPVFGGTPAISSYSVNNNVAVDVDGNTNQIGGNTGAVTTVTSEDLVIFTTPNVLALANNNPLSALSALDFTNAIQDAHGNVATAATQAKVVIADAMPAFVTAATWTGTELVITFNEPVSLTSTSRNIQVFDPTNANPAATVAVSTSNASLDAAGTTMTVNLSTAQANAISLTFNNGATGEFLYNDDSNALNQENHAVLAWDDIRDTAGNNWTFFGSLDNDLTDNRYEVHAPRFLMVNGVGTFTYSVSTTGYLDTGLAGDDDGVVSYVITFTHPIDFTSDRNTAVPADQTALANAISTAVGGNGWAAPGSTLLGAVDSQSLSFSTSTAQGLAVINAVFDTNDIGSDSDTDDTDPGAFVTAAPAAAGQANATFTISSDFRALTLVVTAPANGINFGTTDFLFNTVVDSALINGAQTTAGRFNWQNTN